jgi:hypothetical protein
MSNLVLVLGMHRSGTSCLAGSLEMAGLYLGEVNTYAPFNKKGNRENADIMRLNDNVLSDVGASWDSPPSLELQWSAKRKYEQKAILDKIIKGALGRPVGIKDPRILITLNGWVDGDKFSYCGTFRHPAAVAKSLMRRAQAWNVPMSKSLAYDLWSTYNLKMLEHRANNYFPIVHYGGGLESYQRSVIRIADYLGLSNCGRAEGFYSSELLNEFGEEEIPKSIKYIWDGLNDYAE